MATREREDAAHDAGDDLSDVTDDEDLDLSQNYPDPADDNEEFEDTEAEGSKELCKVIKTETLDVTDENRTQDGEIKDNKLVDCVDKQRDTVKESEKYAVGKTSNECKTSHKQKRFGTKIVISNESKTVSHGMLETNNFSEAQDIEQDHEKSKVPEGDSKKITGTVCEHCGKTFPQNISLVRHVRQLHTDLNTYFPCQHCKRKFVKKEVLEKHMEVHKEKNTCGIDGCSVSFSSGPQLLQHQLFKHRNHMDKNKPFLCGNCGEGFLRKGTLKDHTERKHSKGKALKCSICPKTFSNRLTLREHIRRHKSSTMKYICELCGKVYTSKKGVYKHKTRCHRIGPSPKKEKHCCAVCRREFMRKSSLDHHIIVNNHMTSDQSVASKTVYECDMCSKKFGEKHKYTRHVETVHKKTIVCSCSFCGKGFSDNWNYRQHLQIHTGNKPTCEICKAIFRSQVSRKRHMNEIHSSSQKTDSYLKETGEKSAQPEQTVSLELLNDEHTASIIMEQAVPAERDVTLASEQATADETVTQIVEQPVTETWRHSQQSVTYHVPQPMCLSPMTGSQTVKQLSSSSSVVLPGNNDTTAVTVTYYGDAGNTSDSIASQPKIFD